MGIPPHHMVPRKGPEEAPQIGVSPLVRAKGVYS